MNHRTAAYDHARGELARWRRSAPSNYFDVDMSLQETLRQRLGEDLFGVVAPELERFGSVSASEIDVLAREEDRPENWPFLRRFTEDGERVEQVCFHPNHDQIGRRVWESGMLAHRGAGDLMRRLALYYLLAHNGEAGYACPVIATIGTAVMAAAFADDSLKEQYLGPLTTTCFEDRLEAAFFLTEVQGGSDVGGNQTAASRDADGTWRVAGEKWFCSNASADLFLLSARVDPESRGTRGLAMFLVPRKREDGQVNGFAIRRLKDKLGTRTLASAEIDFDGAVALPFGPLETSFRQMLDIGLNLSRLYNATVCAGAIRRAWLEASRYANIRKAFGKRIAEYPMLRAQLRDIQAESDAAVALCFKTAELFEPLDGSRSPELEVAAIVSNVAKYITSRQASEGVRAAIHVLGGNGTIEPFSVLPRLYRDMLVYETWEGTHNVIALHVAQSVARGNAWSVLDGHFRPLLLHTSERLARQAESLKCRLDELGTWVDALAEPEFRACYALEFTHRLSRLLQAVILVEEAERVQAMASQHKVSVADYFLKRKLTNTSDSWDVKTFMQSVGNFMDRGADA